MFTPNDIFRLPSTLWEDKGQLPEWSGVYFLCANKRILYIGKARNIRKRWLGHERNQEARIISAAGSEVRIHYLAIAPLKPLDDEPLLDVELQMIGAFNPTFNGTPIIIQNKDVTSSEQVRSLNDLILEFTNSDEGVEIRARDG